jgi:hypothetical protein
VGPAANQSLDLTGAAFLFFRDTLSLQRPPQVSVGDYEAVGESSGFSYIFFTKYPLQPVVPTQGIMFLPGEAESGSAGVQPDEE